jgi:hypothetical protein
VHAGAALHKFYGQPAGEVHAHLSTLINAKSRQGARAKSNSLGLPTSRMNSAARLQDNPAA